MLSTAERIERFGRCKHGGTKNGRPSLFSGKGLLYLPFQLSSAHLVVNRLRAFIRLHHGNPVVFMTGLCPLLLVGFSQPASKFNRAGLDRPAASPTQVSNPPAPASSLRSVWPLGPGSSRVSASAHPLVRDTKHLVSLRVRHDPLNGTTWREAPFRRTGRQVCAQSVHRGQGSCRRR